MRGQSRHCRDRKGKPRREIVTVAGEQPHAHAIAPRQNAEAVMLDFVQPPGT